MGPGEVVCDSILQNKEMTKTYWEERMMAAADGGKTHKDSTPKEQQYFDVEIDNSLIDCPDSLETLENVASTSPKIVETMVKSCPEESVIEREIREQQERELAIVQERELKNNNIKTTTDETSENDSTSDLTMQQQQPPVFRQLGNDGLDTNANATTPTENRIALELREMREREEELRQLRQRFCTSITSTGNDLPSDNFQSIPTTDEGNFSEYGSEEKELSLDGGNSGSRVMSPEVPLTQGSFTHQRTQSMDSMSSGHSSGSGGVNHLQQSELHVMIPRRRITVKPLAEPEDEEVPAYIRNRMNETPIEREIRLAAQREEELRAMKGGTPVSPVPPVTPVTPNATGNKWSSPRPGGLANDSRDVQHRIATSRIQQEIQEATQREKELLAAGKIQTISEDTVDSKVTRFTELAEYAIAERERKIQNASTPSTSDIASDDETLSKPVEDVIKPAAKVVVSPTNKIPHQAINLNIVGTPNTPSTPTIKPPLKSPVIAVNTAVRWRKYEPNPGQKGLMQRFLASKGRLVGMSPFTSPTNNSASNAFVPRATPNSPISSPQSAPAFAGKVTEKYNFTQHSEAKVNISNAVDNSETRLEQVTTRPTPQRKGYMSAEEKIQEELIEMKKREDELRLQRAHLFAQSQPNLLSLIDDTDNNNSALPGSHDEDNTIITLRPTLSNPNLLDSDDSLSVTDSSSYQEKTSQKAAIRKRNVLIAQWESMIQQNTSEC